VQTISPPCSFVVSEGPAFDGDHSFAFRGKQICHLTTLDRERISRYRVMPTFIDRLPTVLSLSKESTVISRIF
jgi:hypothetical protein